MRLRLHHLFLATLLQQSLSAEVVIFPAPEGLPTSSRFSVEIKTSEGWQPSFVYFNKARIDGLGSLDEPGRTTSWTTFKCDEPTRLRVTRSSGPFSKAIIRPNRLQILTTKIGKKGIEFTVSPGQKISVEFDPDVKAHAFTGPPHGVPVVMHSLLIFADKKSTPQEFSSSYGKDQITFIEPGSHCESIPVENLPGIKADRATLGNLGGKKVAIFQAGNHDLGYWQVPNNIDHIHLSPGAIVYGAIDVLPQNRSPQDLDIDKVYRDAWFKETLRKEFSITGSGVLCGSKLPWHLKKDFSYSKNDDYWEHIKLLQIAAEEITIKDVTLVDSPYWVLSFLNDTDKRSRGHFSNFKMLGAWSYNNDGLPVPGGANSLVENAFIHANDDALKLYTSGAKVQNCVIWQGPNGAVFQFGWFTKSAKDIAVSMIDIIHNENWYGVDQVNRATINFADASGNGNIENITFRDVHIEGNILRLFGFKTGGGQIIRNFHFNNLHLEGLGAGQLGAPGRNYFSGQISDFTFTNFTIEGEVITKPEEADMDFLKGAGSGFKFSK